jgi:hypothetical protein
MWLHVIMRLRAQKRDRLDHVAVSLVILDSNPCQKQSQGDGRFARTTPWLNHLLTILTSNFVPAPAAIRKSMSPGQQAVHGTDENKNHHDKTCSNDPEAPAYIKLDGGFEWSALTGFADESTHGDGSRVSRRIFVTRWYRCITSITGLATLAHLQHRVSMEDIHVSSELFSAVESGNTARVRELLAADPGMTRAKEDEGATALHYATLHGHREIVELLLKNGADINARDGRFHATPSGWAIEYLRERGGLLAIEIEDVLFAIRESDARWVQRFLTRLPALADACDRQGKPLSEHAAESGNTQIASLFEAAERER